MKRLIQTILMQKIKISSRYGLALAFLTLTNCSSPEPKESWHASMQELSKLMSELMPKIALQKYDLGDQERAQIRGLSNRLSGLSHGISKNTNVPSRDSSLRFTAREFKNEMKEVQLLIDQNRWQEVQTHLNRVAQYCIACHTQTQGASSAFSMTLKPNLHGLSEFDQATYYTTVRQYEQAIIHYENALTNATWTKNNPALWNRGVVQLLAIVTRVKRDPNLLLEMISRFFDTAAYPKDLQNHARIWREHAKKWDAEKTTSIGMNTIRLRMRAAMQTHKGSLDALVLLLRSSADINELLRSGTLKSADEQLAYSYSGQIAESLSDLNDLGFADDYFKICYELMPKSATGKLCQNKLKK